MQKTCQKQHSKYLHQNNPTKGEMWTSGTRAKLTTVKAQEGLLGFVVRNSSLSTFSFITAEIVASNEAKQK